MNKITRAASILLLCASAYAQTRKSALPKFEKLIIGRHTFIDIGPPNDFYEVLTVHSASSGSSVERATFTPPIDACLHPATIEVTNGTLNESIPDLLEGLDPCEIPERKLRRELQRHKKAPNFSGADVVLEVQCEGKTRRIETDILERDWFDSHPQTPEYTSWTMRLLSQLDKVTGPGVLDRPIFADFGPQRKTAPITDSQTLEDAKAGKLDDLFSGDSDRISELYRLAQIPPAIPSARLESSTIVPANWAEPMYPPIAKAARVQGTVVLSLTVDSKGSATQVSFKSGPPMLLGAVQAAAKNWRFSTDSAGKQVEESILFSLNCPAQEKH
jgi:TonB family protein